MSDSPLIYKSDKWHPKNFPEVATKVRGREESIARQAIDALISSNKNTLKAYRILFCGWTPQLFDAISKETLSDIRTYLLHHGYDIPEHDPTAPISSELARAVWFIIQSPPGCPRPDHSNEIKEMRTKYSDQWVL